jgi:hypothetical protein
MLDFVSSESSSSSSDEMSSSEPILASPLPILDLHIATELLPMTEVPEAEAANQEMLVEMGVHVAAREGSLPCFSNVLVAIVECYGCDI